MFGTRQPIAKHFEESTTANLSRRIQIARKRTNRLLVDLKEQAVLGAEMLKNGALGNAQHRGQVTDAGGVIALLGELAHGGFNDPGSLALRTRPRRQVTIARGRDNTATNGTHSLTSSHGTLPEKHSDFNSVFCCCAVM